MCQAALHDTDSDAACAAHSTDGMLTLKAAVTSWVATWASLFRSTSAVFRV